MPSPCKDFNKYFRDIFIASGTRRVVIMHFGNFVVTTFAMVTLFLYFFWIQTICTDINQIVRICLLQRELGLISFSSITGNKCCHGNTFYLHSKPSLDWIILVFLTIPGNKCCHGNTFFCFLDL